MLPVEKKDIFTMTMNDIHLEGYTRHGPIKAVMAV
jgi:thymidylate synthase